jgi:hypothetical protein
LFLLRCAVFQWTAVADTATAAERTGSAGQGCADRPRPVGPVRFNIPVLPAWRTGIRRSRTCPISF